MASWGPMMSHASACRQPVCAPVRPRLRSTIKKRLNFICGSGHAAILEPQHVAPPCRPHDANPHQATAPAARAAQPRHANTWSPFHARVLQDLRDRPLLPPGSKVLVAVSGGQVGSRAGHWTGHWQRPILPVQATALCCSYTCTHKCLVRTVHPSLWHPPAVPTLVLAAAWQLMLPPPPAPSDTTQVTRRSC